MNQADMNQIEGERSQARAQQERKQAEIERSLERLFEADHRLATRDGDLAIRRTVALKQVSGMLAPLTRYIDDELRHLIDEGLVEESGVDQEEVLMNTITEAAEQLTLRPPPVGLYPWLREITRRELQRAVRIERERAESELSLESPVRLGKFDEWPERVRRLKQVLEDPRAILPEEVLAGSEVRQIIAHGLDRLPVRWREIFLLRTVDGWDDDEIATAEGIGIEEVELINIASRAFLREFLLEHQEFDQLAK